MNADQHRGIDSRSRMLFFFRIMQKLLPEIGLAGWDDSRRTPDRAPG